MTEPAENPTEIGEEEARAAFTDGYDEALDSLGRFNLAIVGDTGVGKSSLVNAIFGDVRAPTGIGAPVTKDAEYYVNDDDKFGVWDFEGFEHGTKAPPLKTLVKRVKAIQASDRPTHVAWFCWEASNARVTDGHKLLVEALTKAGVPVIGVLTKVHKQGDVVSPQHREFATWIEDQAMGFAVPAVYLTAAEADESFGLEAHGLNELLHATIGLAPEAAKDALRRSQKIDLQLKRNLAWKWITAGIAAAGTVAATPLPIASAAALAPIQLGMFGRVAAIYGQSVKDILGEGAQVQLLLSLTGKAAAQSLVKFVPGAGSVINATVASVWTGAAGEIWRRYCEDAAEGRSVAKNFREFEKMFGPAVQSLFKSWMADGGKPKAP